MAKQRQRNYKAEYERRLAKGAASGKSRQLARGHKVKEHVERKRRAIVKYGVSPSQLTRLRKLAFDKAKAVHDVAGKQAVYEKTLLKGIRLLHGDDLQALIDMDPLSIVSAVKIDDAHLAALDEYFPHSTDAIEGESWNPLWYHR